MSLVVGWTLKENVLDKQRKRKQERLQRERYQRVYEREFREGQCDQNRQKMSLQRIFYTLLTLGKFIQDLANF